MILLFAVVLAIAQLVIGLTSLRGERDKNFRRAFMTLSLVAFLATVGLAVSTYLDDARERETENLNIGLQRQIIASVERTARPIESITLLVEFIPPLLDPRGANHKADLDRAFQEAVSALPNDSEHMTVCGNLVRVEDRGIGDMCMDRAHPLFPDEALALTVLEASFFRAPTDVTQFRASWDAIATTEMPPPRAEPDLNLPFRFRPQPLRGDLHADGIDYRLPVGPFTVPRGRWRVGANGIDFVQDLTGAQLLINIGRRLSTEDSDLAAKFEVGSFSLLINNQPTTVDALDLEKSVTNTGDVVWEFRFPMTIDEIFGVP